jgi:transposase InsO family protein
LPSTISLKQASTIAEIRTRVIVEAWRREYNEERPKKSLGGLTPAAHTQRLMQNPLN